MSVSLIIRAAAMFVSLFGYLQYFSRKIKTEFAVGVTFALIGGVMFLAGILNIMPLSVYAVTAVGVCLSVTAFKDIKNSVMRIITPGTVFFAGMSAVLAFSIKGSLFAGSDAYHHWGIISRLLISYDRLPTPENFNISFPSYPTGSASFIYYFASMLNADSEWFIILIQTVLTLGMLISIFAFAKGKLANIATCVIVTVFLCTNEPFQFIVVDNLLAAITVAGLSIAVFYKDEIAGKLVYVLPFTIFLTAVKNSGVLFAFFIVFYCFLYIPKNKTNLAKSAGLLVSPFATLILWQKHVDLLFPQNRSEAHHAMSVDHYEAMYREKVELNIISNTWDMYSNHVFSLSNVVVFVAVIVILCLVYSYITDKKLNRDFLQIAGFSAFIYVVYQIGLLGTYIFSMPVYELDNRTTLPSYERYHLTIIVVIAALVYTGIIHYLKKQNGNSANKAVFAAVMLAGVLLAGAACKPQFSYFKPQTHGDIAHDLEYRNLLSEYAVPHRCSYLVIGDSYNYLTYHTKYLLDPTDCMVWSFDTFKKNNRYINNFDYLILVDNSAETMEFVSQLLGAEISERVVHIASYIDQVPVTD